MNRSKGGAMLRAMLWLLGVPPAAQALDAAAVKQLAAEDSDSKLEAINKLVTSGDTAALPIFKALQDDVLQVYQGRVALPPATGVRDALTGEAIDVAGATPDRKST